MRPYTLALQGNEIIGNNQVGQWNSYTTVRQSKASKEVWAQQVSPHPLKINRMIDEKGMNLSNEGVDVALAGCYRQLGVNYFKAIGKNSIGACTTTIQSRPGAGVELAVEMGIAAGLWRSQRSAGCEDDPFL